MTVRALRPGTEARPHAATINPFGEVEKTRSPLEPNPPIPVRADPDVFTIINGSALSNKSQLSDGTGTLGRR